MAHKGPQRHHPCMGRHFAGPDERSVMHTQPLIPPNVPANAPGATWTQASPWWWGQPAALKSRARPNWRMVLPAMRPSLWPVVITALLALGLLLAFQQVVAQVVVQADQQRAATLAQHEIAWGCKLMREPRERDGCLAQVSAAHQQRLQPGQPVAEVATVTDAGLGAGRDHAATRDLVEVFEE
jgi:hypothetical protein